MVMAITDSAFLLGESREHPTHVALLQLFRPPPDSGPEYVSEFYRDLLTRTEVSGTMRRRPVRRAATLGQWSWVRDEDVELEYHVRLSALPRPGRVRELLELVSRLHGSLLDRHRPLWEMNVIEGLADGRFAVYTKVHHALMDGVTAVRRVTEGLSTERDGESLPPWAPSARARADGGAKGDVIDQAWGRVKGVTRMATEVAGTPAALTKALVDAYRDGAATLPFEAPKTMFNVPIGGARRFAAQSWPLDRIRAVGAKADATINDVAVAMCAGALRRYLIDQDALPDRSLVAMLPVSLRAADTAGSSEGNAVGAILCDLATDQPDPSVRLARIRASTRHAKAMLSGLNPTEIVALASVLVAGLAVAPVPGLRGMVPPPFNLIISNVPGSREKLYWNGAELVESYPLSIPAEGQAVNMTLTSYAGQLSFGITGCRRTVPHLQRLLDHLDAELDALEA
ncbi:WS/DGAT/MGAT family O-acyltransferase [Pseudonocardia spinosispora]|uniref:WS/DGAT/MGAT family O-acyltransferase n=1 Tax=Pseudonocardia spinosispora TaxID=103441 RepID=UPI0005603FFC|nr:wax ester/triacylglycerol synthase family O-acyltransferase [Pseudonocardia spinosispora]